MKSVWLYSLALINYTLCIIIKLFMPMCYLVQFQRHMRRVQESPRPKYSSYDTFPYQRVPNESLFQSVCIQSCFQPLLDSLSNYFKQSILLPSLHFSSNSSSQTPLWYKSQLWIDNWIIFILLNLANTFSLQQQLCFQYLLTLIKFEHVIRNWCFHFKWKYWGRIFILSVSVEEISVGEA